MSTLIQTDEAEGRLNDPNNLLNKLRGEFVQSSSVSSEPEVIVVEQPLHNGGRNEGDGNIPHKVQAMIGVLAHMDTAKNVGSAFDVSRQQVVNLKGGRTTDKHGQNPRLVSDMQLKREQIADVGLTKLIETVKTFKLEDIVDQNKKIDAAAKLANIVDKMVPAEKDNGRAGTKVQVNIFAPRAKDMDEYEVLEVQAEEVE